ncbi:MAG: glycerate kinase [Cyanobacteria bacterium SBC]|nr:glycerate kinase [Cyanobacteria bacterium SBC]
MDDLKSQLIQAIETLDDTLSSWLQQRELQNDRRAKAFGITSETVGESIDRRLQLLRKLADTEFVGMPLKDRSNAHFWPTLWDLWLPLALQLAEERRQLDRPFVQGILGGQGTGKTTLAAALTRILNRLGFTVVSVSIDDLYKTHEERQQLKREDPRFVRRGPPGTHDIALGLEVLDRLRQSQTPLEIPRFDKSAYGGDGDRSTPEVVEKADIVLFEGWFVGARPVDEAAFDNPPPPIATSEDQNFARHCNRLLRDYLPLWERLDRLMVLYPVDYHLSQQWRLQAEHDAIAQGKDGMSDAEIFEFVEYFWKALHPQLFVDPLFHDRSRAQLVVKIEADRSIGEISGSVET